MPCARPAWPGNASERHHRRGRQRRAFIAEQLHTQGHDVTILDNDRDVVAQGRRSGEPVGVTWHEGDACEIGALTTVGLAEADVIAAVTGDDEDNLVVSLLAKQEFGVPRVVARVNNPKNEWLFNEVWGVDAAVSTPHLLTALVEEAVAVGSFIRLLSFEGGRAKLAEVTLAAGSPVDGKTIEELGVPRRRDGRRRAAQRAAHRAPGRHDAARRRRGHRAGDRPTPKTTVNRLLTDVLYRTSTGRRPRARGGPEQSTRCDQRVGRVEHHQWPRSGTATPSRITARPCSMPMMLAPAGEHGGDRPGAVGHLHLEVRNAVAGGDHDPGDLAADPDRVGGGRPRRDW